MVLTSHAAAGALAGSATRSLGVAFALGVLTHAVLDRIPHADYRVTAALGALLLADLAFAAAVVLAMRRPPGRTLVAGAIGGLLPDAAQGLERALGVDVTLSAHLANHTEVDWPVWAGTMTQVATVVLCVAAFRLLARRGQPRCRGDDAVARD